MRSALGKTHSHMQVGLSLKSLSKYILKHLPGEAPCPALVKPKGITQPRASRSARWTGADRGQGHQPTDRCNRVLQGALAQGSRKTVEKA